MKQWTTMASDGRLAPERAALQPELGVPEFMVKLNCQSFLEQNCQYFV